LTERDCTAVVHGLPTQLKQCVQRAICHRHVLRSWSWPQQSQHKAEAAILIPFFASAASQAAAPGGSPSTSLSAAATAGQLRLLLTRRARHLRRHAGQMSFPGGVLEPGDNSLLDTAMRETTEETGVHGSYIQPLGKLGDMLTISGYRLHVYIAWLQAGFELQPDPGEVEAVYAADVETALDARHYHWQPRETPAGSVQMPEMVLEQQRVWGITAVIIWHLSCLWHDHLYLNSGHSGEFDIASVWQQQTPAAGRRSQK